MAADRKFRGKQTGRNNEQMEGRMREAEEEEGSRKERVGTEEEEKILKP